MVRRKKNSKNTRQARDGTPNIFDGIKFKSKLETNTYRAMKEAGIIAKYEPESFTILPAFSFMGAKIRAITYKPDFIYANYIIECKGFGNDAWPIREKLFKYYLHSTASDYKYYVVRNMKEVLEVIQEIKQHND